MADYVSEDDILRVLENPIGKTDTILAKITEKSDLLNRLTKLSGHYVPPSSASAQKLKAKEIGEDKHFTGSEQEIAVITVTANILHIDELLSLQLWTTYVSQLLTKPSLSSSFFTSPSTLIDLCQLHYDERLRTWKLLQEMLRIDNDREHPLHDPIANLIERLLQRDFMANLLCEVNYLYTSNAPEFQASHVTSLSMSSGDITSLKRSLHTLWVNQRCLEVEYAIETMILLYYRRDANIDTVLRCLEIAVTHQFAYPAQASGDISLRLASRWVVLFVEWLQFWRSNCVDSFPTPHPLVSMDFVEKYDKIQNLLHKNLTARNKALLPQSVFLLTWGFFLQTHSASLTTWSGQRHVGCYGQALQYDVLGYVCEILRDIAGGSDATLYSLVLHELVNCIVRYICIERVHTKVNLSYIDVTVGMIAALYHQSSVLCDEFFAHWKAALSGSLEVLPVCYLLYLLSERSSHSPEIFFRFMECLIVHETSATEMLLLLLSQVPLIMWLPFEAVKVESNTGSIPCQRYFSDPSKFPAVHITLATSQRSDKYNYFLCPDASNEAHLVSVDGEAGQALLQWNKKCSWFTILLSKLEEGEEELVSIGLGVLRRIIQHFPIDSLSLLSEQFDQLQLVMFLHRMSILELYTTCYENGITLRNLGDLSRCNVNEAALRYLHSVPYTTLTFRQHLSHVASFYLSHPSVMVSRRGLNLLSTLIHSSTDAIDALGIFIDRFEFNSSVWYKNLLGLCEKNREITEDVFAFFDAVLTHVVNKYLDIGAVLSSSNNRILVTDIITLLRHADLSSDTVCDMAKEYGDRDSIAPADLLHFIGSNANDKLRRLRVVLRHVFAQQASPQMDTCYHNVMLFCMEMIVTGSAAHVIMACNLIEKHFVRVVSGDSEYCVYHDSLRSSFGTFVAAILHDPRFQNAYSGHMLRLVHAAMRHQGEASHKRSTLKALLNGPPTERSFALLPVNFSALQSECDVTMLETVAESTMRLFSNVIHFLERFDATAIDSYVRMLTQSSQNSLLLLLCYLDYPLSAVFSLRRYSSLCELSLNIVNDTMLYAKSPYIDIIDVSNMAPLVQTLAAILTSTTESSSLKLAVLKHLITVTNVDTYAMLRLCFVQNASANESCIVHALDLMVQDTEQLYQTSPDVLHAFTSFILALLSKQNVLEQIILKVCRPRHFWDSITSPLMVSVDDTLNVAMQCSQLLVHRDVLLLLAHERYGVFRQMNEAAGTSIERACDAFFEKATRAHRFVVWIRQYMKISLPQWRDEFLNGTVEIVAPLQHSPHCIGKVRVDYGDRFGVYSMCGDTTTACREQSLIHARLQLLQGWKRFITIYVLPTSSAMTAESDVGGLSPGRYSTGSDSPPDSPSLRKESSFVGDKRSYELLSEIMKHVQNICPQFDALNPVAIPPATLTVCGDVLYVYFELLVSMLHHQLKEISLRTFDPSYSEIHSRDIGNMRLTPSKMTFIVHAINDVCNRMQLLLSTDRMLPTYMHCYSSLLLLLRALANSSVNGANELPQQLCFDVYAHASKVFAHLTQQTLDDKSVPLLQVILRIFNVILPRSLLHEGVGDSLQWRDIIEETSLKARLVILFRATMSFDDVVEMHAYSWHLDAMLYPQGSSTAQISITTNTSLSPPPPQLKILLSVMDIFIHKPSLCFDAEILPIILQSRFLSKYQSLLLDDNNCLMPYHAYNGEPALSYLCVKKIIQYMATLVPALADLNRLESQAHFILQFSHTYSHLLYTFLPNGKVRISSLQLEITKDILFLFAILHRHIPSWRIAHTGHHVNIVLLLSYFSFLVGGAEEHYAIAHQRILHGASIAVSQSEKYEEKSLTTRPNKVRKVETPERSLIKVSLPMERSGSGTFSDTWKQLFRQGTDDSTSIKHSMKFLDELIHRILNCLHPLLLCIHDITPTADAFMHAEHLVVGTEVYVTTDKDVCCGQIIASHDNCFDIQLANGVIERGVRWQQVAFTTPPLFDFGSKYDLPFAVEQFMRKALHHPTTAHLVQLLQFIKRWHEDNCQYVTRRSTSHREVDMIVSEIVYIASITIAHHSVTTCDLQQLLDQMQSIVELIEPQESQQWLVTEEWDCVRHWVLRIIEFINSSASENRSWTYALVETEKQSAKRFLIEHGADINKRNEYGRTALHWACYRDRFHVVQYLVANGAAINAQDNDGYTALHRASEGGYTSICELLIANGADVTIIGEYGETASDIATNEEIRSLLIGAAQIAECVSASARGDISLVNKLLQDSPHLINGINHEDRTPLMAASEAGQKDMVCLLLERGAVIQLKNKIGLTALRVARNETIFQILQIAECVSASARGDISLVNRLLQDSPHLINGINHEDRTPLMAASEAGQKDMVCLLLERGANVGLLNENGYDALSYSADNEISEMLRDVLEPSRRKWEVCRLLCLVVRMKTLQAANDGSVDVRVVSGINAMRSAFPHLDRCIPQHIANMIPYRYFDLNALRNETCEFINNCINDYEAVFEICNDDREVEEWKVTHRQVLELRDKLMLSSDIGIDEDDLGAGAPIIQLEDIDIDDSSLISSTHSSSVYRGKYRSIDVALKIIHKNEQMSFHDLSQQPEIKILSSLRHPRVLTLMGVVCDMKSMLGAACGLVTEYMSRGSLYHVLHEDTTPVQNRLTSLPSKLRVLRDVADGMRYLHSCEVIHRDMKSPNVLLDEEGRAKICDFGVSKLVSGDSTEASTAVGTTRWSSPEALLGETGVRKSTDVYSFGVMMWEMITNTVPWKNLSAMQIAIRISRGDNLVLPAVSEDAPEALMDVLKQCLDRDPGNRPLFPDLYESFNEMLTAWRNPCPVEYICPISHEIMTDPVSCNDGHTYDRISIETWLENHNTSPLTNAVLSDLTLRPNIVLRGLIQSYVANNK